MILALMLQLAIVAPVAPHDTAGHVDLYAGQSLTLAVRHDSAWPVVWKSGNSTIVSVSTKGVLLAKQRGTTTLTAIRHGDTARTRVCVANTVRDTIPWVQVTASTNAAAPITSLIGFMLPAKSTLSHQQLTASTQLTPSTLSASWLSCVHWTLDSASATYATISRSGLLRSPRSVSQVLATIGPSIP